MSSSNRRILFELRDEKRLNIRDVTLDDKGNLDVGGHDLDPDLEAFVGDDEWEGDIVVKAKDVPRVLEALVAELGPGSVLDLIQRKFGGTIKAMDNFESWLNKQGIPYDSSSWS